MNPRIEVGSAQTAVGGGDSKENKDAKKKK